MTTDLLTVDEVAERLRVTVWFLRRELNGGRLRGSKVAGHWRIPADAVEEYLAAHSNTPVTAVHPNRRRRRRSA